MLKQIRKTIKEVIQLRTHRQHQVVAATTAAAAMAAATMQAIALEQIIMALVRRMAVTMMEMTKIWAKQMALLDRQ